MATARGSPHPTRVTILREPTIWRRPSTRGPRPSDLSSVEQANVKRALRVLARRVGGQRQLAAAMGIGYTAGVALRAARLALVHVEDVLSGAWPGKRCPHCGRG